MRRFVIMSVVLLLCAGQVNASFMIRGATGTDGWAVPPHQNTAGNGVMLSYESGATAVVTFSRLVVPAAAECAVVDGFGGILAVDDVNSLLVVGLPAEAPRVYEPNDPNYVNLVTAVRTRCIIHTSEASLRANPLVGDPNLSEELTLVVSALLESGDYYLRYHWPRRELAPGTYYVALVTQTTGAACGWRESIIDVSNDVWVDTLFPGEVFEYSDEPNEYPYASAAVDIYGYLKGTPMLIRNAISDDHLEPNAPAVAPTWYPPGVGVGAVINLDQEGKPGYWTSEIGGGGLRLAETSRLTKFAWFGAWYQPGTGSDWRLAVISEQSTMALEDLFFTDPLGSHTDVFTFDNVVTVDYGEFIDITGRLNRLAHHEASISVVLAAASYITAPYVLNVMPDVQLGWGNGGSAYWYPEAELMWNPRNSAVGLWFNFREVCQKYLKVSVSGRTMVDIWAEAMPSYGATDLARLSDNWLRTDSGPHNDWAGNADLNRDGKVDHDDFVILKADWTGSEPPVEPGTDTAYEDFETGDFSALDWQHSGHSPWVVTTSESYSGRYSARAGAVSDREKSTLTLTRTCIAGQISFYVKTSSEPSYDALHFRVDGQERGSYSGAEDWTYVTVPVTAGSHTFEWSYEKDSSVSEGDDTVWLDDVVFPVP